MVFVPNGVERPRFATTADRTELRRRLSIADDAPVVGYIGTLSVHSHAVDLLLSAFRYIVNQVPSARLVLVGGGEDIEALMAQAQALGIGGSIVFAARVEPSAIPAYYAMADVTVDPVRDDLTARARSPLKVLESLTMGVPVVTGDIGDRRELLASGDLGVLVTPGSEGDLATGLLSLLNNVERRHTMAQRALAQRERWFWDHLARDFATVYATADAVH
jgi:glycosyltransferase involved in cell wall biosynthesis